MAPDDLSKVETNLTTNELKAVLAAIEKKEVEWTDEGGLFAGSSTAYFTWKGSKYELHEDFELLDWLMKMDHPVFDFKIEKDGHGIAIHVWKTYLKEPKMQVINGAYKFNNDLHKTFRFSNPQDLLDKLERM